MGLFGRWKTIISNGSGGSLPSNVVLFEDWTGGESVTIDTSTSPTDTTAPIVTISPNGGTFASSLNVTLSANETSTIYYTIDGTNPTTSSLVYSSAISLINTTTIKFFAKDTVGNQSAIQSVAFTKDTTAPSDTTAPVVTASIAGGTYTSTQTVTLSANETSDIYYTLDGTEPTTSSTKYVSPISISTTTTLKFFGRDTAGNTSSVQSNVYTINSGAVSGTVLISDSFNRADSTTLGNSETGQAWTQYSDVNGTVTHGVRSNKFYMSGGTNATVTNRFRKQATQTVSTNNFELQTTIVIPANVSATLAIGLRFISNTNLLYLQANASGGTVPRYKLTKLPSGGSVTDLASGSKVPANGDIVKVKHYSSGLIEVYVNDVLDFSVTDTYNLSESIKVGLGMDNDTLGFDDFKVTAL